MTLTERKELIFLIFRVFDREPDQDALVGTLNRMYTAS